MLLWASKFDTVNIERERLVSTTVHNKGSLLCTGEAKLKLILIF